MFWRNKDEVTWQQQSYACVCCFEGKKNDTTWEKMEILERRKNSGIKCMGEYKL